MRNATVYGASPRLRLDIVLNNLVAWAHTTGAIRLQSDGTSWRPLVHVRDVARGRVALLEAPAELVAGEAFNVGCADQNYRIRDLAEIVRARLTECEVTFADGRVAGSAQLPGRLLEARARVPRRSFEWDAERGAEELVTRIAQLRLTNELFEGGRYVRLRQLRHLLDEGGLEDRASLGRRSRVERAVVDTRFPAPSWSNSSATRTSAGSSPASGIRTSLPPPV